MKYNFVTEKPKATVIIPTIGKPELAQAINSCMRQTYKTNVLVVGDGSEYFDAIMRSLSMVNHEMLPGYTVTFTPENTGGKGFYGHKIYAAYPLLVESDYYFFLDEDNWFEPDHVESLIATMNSGVHFTYSLRNIYSDTGEFICQDNCESLGAWPIFGTYNNPQYLIDTSAYCFRKDFIQENAHQWNSGWGGDRRFLQIMRMFGANFKGSNKHTLNYRLGGNENSVKKEFFIEGNKKQLEHYEGKLPWIS